MKFRQLSIGGAYLIGLEKRIDERGSLARTWCAKEFADNGIKASLLQGYSSFTKKKGTMRGIHYQTDPVAEAKLTRILSGSIYEVIIDVRPESPTFMKSEGITLSAEDDVMMFIPENVGHGFLTLTDDVAFLNFSSQPFTPEFEKGIRYNDPAFGISWPITIESVSPKDTSWEYFKKVT